MPIRWPSISRRSSSQGSPKKGERAVSDPPMRTEDSDSVPADATEALLEQTAPKDLRSIDPGLSRIVTDAALYEQVVSEELSGGASPELTLYESLRGFSRLVGKDLDSSEKHASIRLAQLSVNNWASNPFREPVDIEEEPEESSPEVSLDETPSTLTLLEERTDDFERLEAAERELEAMEGSRNLHPDHIVHLLENEFGCLAGPGEERLLLEADCALVHDVLLLGVLHLTNRRISFHASLLSTKPDDTKIIKAGPVTVRLKGWRRKRRVWMELSHDIICTYPSSKDEHRIKPYRSILLSSIKSVEKLDKDHPRVVRISYEGIGGPKDDTILEFDTVESAREWNREVHGAAFLYRQNRRRALEPDNIEDANGVRFNIPLSRLDEVDYSIFMSFANLVKLKVAIGQQLPLDGEHLQERSSSGPSGLSASEALSAAIDRIPSSSDPDDTSDFAQDTHTLQIAILKEEPELRNLVSLAKEARTYEKTQNMTVPQAHFDFDATGYGLEDFEGQEFNAIANALGIRRKPWTVKACITRRFSRLYGTFVVADEIIGFISKSITLSQVMYRIPIARVVGVRVSGSQRIDNTLVLEVHGQSDIRFSFRSEARRDEAIAKVREAIDKHKQDTLESLVAEPLMRGWDNTTDVRLTASPSPGASPADSPACSTPVRDGSPVPSSKRTSRNMTAILAPLSRIPLVREAAQVPYELRQHMPKAVNIPPGVGHSLNVTKMHVVCLTIGSRGDVQPYIALARGLQAHGHTVTIVTHEEYKTWVEGFGVDHRTAGGDPGALMKLSVENRMFSPQFFKESLTNFRTWLDQLLIDAWEQCQDADLLLESPSAMAGVHIAEALKIPYFRTFTMPWTKTRAFPHAFLSPPVESPTFNSASYVLFDNVFWAATSGQINRWRKSTLKIGPTDMGHMAQSKIPFIYNFSSAVVPKPLDYGDTITLSGYWFLDNPDLNWEPPQTLLDFMKAARDDGRPLVYIGFGSIVVPDPTALAKNIIQAVVKANARAIISRGWSARMAKPDTTQEVEYPEQCYVLDKVPHDWLFPQMDAVVHHGGAGTTGASLRAGVPTLIRPWFGDQFFWASRVQKLGAGIRIHSLRSELADALIRATTDRVMKEKASMVGERIRSEDGVASAIEAIYMYLPRARRNRAELD